MNIRLVDSKRRKEIPHVLFIRNKVLVYFAVKFAFYIYIKNKNEGSNA